MSVVTLAEAKTHLNITAATSDTELQLFIDRSEAAIARRVGPLAASATTVTVDGGACLLLPTTPAISLTSVTDVFGVAVTVADLMLTPQGVVAYTSGGSFPAPRYTVVYSAGRASTPDDLKLAVLELVRHLWSSQRGPTQRPGSAQFDGAANTLAGAGYLLPFRVLELIESHLQIGL